MSMIFRVVIHLFEKLQVYPLFRHEYSNFPQLHHKVISELQTYIKSNS